MQHLARLTGMSLLFVVASLPAWAYGPVSPDAVIQAFMDNEGIRAIYQDCGDEITFADPRVVMTLDSSCGGAGCSRTILVAQNVNYKEVNPWSKTILAVVYISPVGKIGDVQRVRLVPYKAGEGEVPSVCRRMPQVPRIGK